MLFFISKLLMSNMPPRAFLFPRFSSSLFFRFFQHEILPTLYAFPLFVIAVRN
jgi:hypothetical protein